MRWYVAGASAVQQARPRLLLLHGTGSSSGSWSRLVSALGGRFEIIAPDLPGHGRSGNLPPGKTGLDAFASSLTALSGDLGWPDLIVGHSAGAAIAAKMLLAKADALQGSAGADVGRVRILSINGALRPLSGLTAAAFVPMARLMGSTPFVPGLMASAVSCLVAADRGAVRRLLDSTGSRVDPGMVGLYQNLLRSPAHVAGTLRMLTHWDLSELTGELPRLGSQLTLIVGESDKTVAPSDADWVRARVPGCGLVRLPGLGHLAHEEQPARIARIIVESLAGADATAPPNPIGTAAAANGTGAAS